MGIGSVFLNFLQRIAIGAAAVFVLLLVIQLKLPKRSAIKIGRQKAD
jgi:hypothetical protein